MREGFYVISAILKSYISTTFNLPVDSGLDDRAGAGIVTAVTGLNN